MTYQLTKHDTIIRLADGAFIPADPANADYAAYIAWRDAGNVPLPADEPRLDELKAAKLREINAVCDREIGALKATYPETEVLSWGKQEREAYALIADPAAVPPLVDGIAAARGLSRLDLAQKIIANVEAFAAYSAPIIGKRQVLEKRIESATTAEQVAEISWT